MMMGLFSRQEIQKMLAFSKEYFKKLREKVGDERRKSKIEDVPVRFKVSLTIMLSKPFSFSVSI